MFDAAVPSGDPLASWLAGAGFEPYGEIVTAAVALEALRAAPHAAGITIESYRNEWTDHFQRAERQALEGTAAFAEIGQPSGYEGAAGFDAFLIARRADRIVGFAQAQLPEGWVNWMGVVPDERRRGIGRLLVDHVARAVRTARGTHVGADVDADGPGPGFWRALGASLKGRRVLLIRRA